MVIRPANAEDCPAMLELIRELAEYEKAPNEVTVDPIHFEKSGFGPNPVWWAFVVEEGGSGGRGERSNKVDGLESVKGVEEVHGFDNIEGVEVVSPPPPLIAFALYYIRYSTWKGKVMYLEDILVTEKMRGKGIGKMLMNRLIEEAKEKGFKRISWQVLDWNQSAIEFYKKYGVSFDGEWVNVSLDL